MASKGGVGIDLDVARVPLREAGMEPFEIMVSESQERMLCVCSPDRLDDVLAVCATWEVHGTAIGEVTGTGQMRVFDGDRLVGDMPVVALVDDCPLYDLAPERPAAPLYAPAPPVLAPDLQPRDALLPPLCAPPPGPRARSPAPRRTSRPPPLAERRAAAAAVPPVRLARAVAHGAPAGGGRRG